MALSRCGRATTTAGTGEGEPVDDLIEALTIFKKYQKPTQWPTGCLHDELYINGVRRRDVSLEDRKRLRKLGFLWNKEERYYYSFRFGK